MTIVHAKPRILAAIPPDRHAVIEASAGTGKTYTLEHLVVELLLGTDAELESILVVTYTERAAAELRVRLRAKLRSLLEPPSETAREGDPAWVIDERARAKLMRALTSFDLATISTIHAFCQQTLIEHAFASRRLFEQQLVDGRIAFSRAFMTTLRTSLAREAESRELLEAWLLDGSLAELESLLYDCAQKRGALAPPYSPPAIAEALEKLCTAGVGLPAFVGVLSLELKRSAVHGRTITAIVERFDRLGHELAEWREHKSVARMLLALGRETGKSGMLGFLVEKLSAKPPKDPRVKDAAAAIAALCRALVPLASATAESFLPVITQELAREKARTGQLDFDDMLSLLWDSLDGPRGEEVARALRGRYRAALVDEFQDTDEIQWRIFERVFVESEKNRLYVIGDPKQAIYAFRGADVFTYLTATSRIAARDGAKVSLVENYRSTRAMIEAINTILDQSAEKPFFAGDIRYDHPVVAARPDEQGDLPGPPVRLFEVVPEDGAITSGAAKAALGRRIARETAALLAEGVAPNEVFVLARSAKECVDVGKHLRRAAIPHAFYKQDGLFQTEEAKDIRDLIAAIADPESTSRRLRAWIGPFFCVPIASLPACVDLPASHPLMSRLFDWKALADAKDYARLFTSILEDSGVVRREIFFVESERELTNYLHIFELLLEEASRARPTLEELAHVLEAFIEGRRLPEGDNGNVQRLESERAAVQLMTMHKAKGLEARVVFLYGGFVAPKDSQVHVFHEGGRRLLSLSRTTNEAIERERVDEDRRLLYVAITRAKERLYLPYFPPAAPGESKRAMRLDGPYATLNAALDRIGASPLFARESIVAVRAPAIEAPAFDRAALAAWTPPEDLLAFETPPLDFAGLRRRSRSWVITSYSRIKASKGGYRPPEDEVAPDVDAIGSTASKADELPGGTATGRFLHEVLEKIPFESVTSSPSVEYFRARSDVREVFLEAMRAFDREPRHLAHAQELVYTALATPLRLSRLELPHGFAGADRVVREMEFLYPIPDNDRRDRGFIKGYIDLVFEQNGRVFLLDWKSDLLASYGADTLEVHASQNYGLQAELYALALVKQLGLTTRGDYEERFGGTIYCFVRGMKSGAAMPEGVIYKRPSWRDVLESEERLRSIEIFEGGIA